MHSLVRRAWFEVDLGALRRNAATIAARAGVPLLPMVKADAYGLGAARIARALDETNPWGFGVATVTEGEELRRAGITRPILCFTPVLAEDLDGAERSNLTPVLATAATIKRWSETRQPWHLDIDTGMGRAGVRWDEVGKLLDLLAAYPPSGAFTHFHSADLPDGSMEEQVRRFEEALATLPNPTGSSSHREQRRHDPTREILVDVRKAGSVSLRGERRSGIADRRRAGCGAPGSYRRNASYAGRQTVSYEAAWTAQGRRRIATVPVGYADGYRRILSNRGRGILRGQMVPIAGNVTMDMTMFDVTDVPCEIGDVVTMIGSDGDHSIAIADIAALGGLSPYEVLTSLRSRLPRRYFTSDP